MVNCVIHGSFNKHLPTILEILEVFTQKGINVLAPVTKAVVSSQDGFVLFEGEENLDPRLVEINYLRKLKRLNPGFSYFANPGGYLGKSASYELGVAQSLNVPCFFLDRPKDLPVYTHGNSIWKPEQLATFIETHGKLPEPKIVFDEQKLHELWTDLIVPGSIVAVGGIIEHALRKEVLLVKTHKWGGRFSIVGGKVRRNERLEAALLRETKEETGLDGRVGKHLCTFDQVKNSGYYKSGIQHIFVDNVFQVDNKKVTLNEEAEDFVWMPVDEALRSLDIEANARHTLEIYAKAGTQCIE